MTTDYRNKMIESNLLANKLENAGFSLQGRTKRLKQVAVLNPTGRVLFFDSYTDAAESLL